MDTTKRSRGGMKNLGEAGKHEKGGIPLQGIYPPIEYTTILTS